MSDFDFWLQIYRAIMMIASAVRRRHLTKTPSGQRTITADGGEIIGVPGYDIDIQPEKV
jgi:hypothetical protein